MTVVSCLTELLHGFATLCVVQSMQPWRHTCTCVWVCGCVCLRMYMYMYIYVYIYIYIQYIYIYIHIFIYNTYIYIYIYLYAYKRRLFGAPRKSKTLKLAIANSIVLLVNLY
jgi:hypothetical protein